MKNKNKYIDDARHLERAKRIRREVWGMSEEEISKIHGLGKTQVNCSCFLCKYEKHLDLEHFDSIRSNDKALLDMEELGIRKNKLK